MNSKLPVIMVAAAIALLALGCFAMVRVGNNSPSGAEVASGGEVEKEKTGAPKELLKPTATFNVTTPHPSGVQVVPEMAEVISHLHDDSRDPMEDLQCVEEVIRFHARVFRTIPGGGENVDIIRALTGGNSKKLALIPPDHPSLNERGELVDRWGTPFHFHPVSSKILEVRSAGPDKTLWTEDDLEISERDTMVRGS